MLTRWNKETHRRFLADLAETGNVTVSARRIGISRSAVYDRAFAQPRFQAALQDARDAARDRIRREAWRRAVDGDAQPLIQAGVPVHDDHGQPVMVVRYSDRLLLHMIKRLREADAENIADFCAPGGINPD